VSITPFLLTITKINDNHFRPQQYTKPHPVPKAVRLNAMSPDRTTWFFCVRQPPRTSSGTNIQWCWVARIAYCCVVFDERLASSQWMGSWSVGRGIRCCNQCVANMYIIPTSRTNIEMSKMDKDFASEVVLSGNLDANEKTNCSSAH